MDAIYVGIDVSKDRLDVHVRPREERFAVSRTGAGIAELAERLRPLAPRTVAIMRRSQTATSTITLLAGLVTSETRGQRSQGYALANA